MGGPTLANLVGFSGLQFAGADSVSRGVCVLPRAFSLDATTGPDLQESWQVTLS